MGKRIMIMAGGTGGHVFPALAVAEHLRGEGWDVSWLGTEKGLEAKVVPEKGFEIDWMSVAGIRGKGVFSKLKSVFLLFKACWQAFGYLRKRRPDVVLGMGGFVAGPGGLMAKMLGIPLVIHEQNRVVGTTNRLLARMASRVLEAFPGSFPEKNGAVCTGNPLRRAFCELETKEQAGGKPLRVLIVGGSQGAQVLNQTVPEAVARLDGILVRHQTGAAMQQEVESTYKKLGVDAQVSAFIDDMKAAYLWADMVICRSGAMTVSEVAACGIPAIFIPFPFAIDNHQLANARYLADDNGALILEQTELTSETLMAAITQILDRREDMARASKEKARLDATVSVAGICIEEAAS